MWGNRGPVAADGKRAAAEVALAAANLAAVIARRGDGSSDGSVRPEAAASGGASGERRGLVRRHGRGRGMGETREGTRGRVFMGEGGADVAGDGPYLAGDVGSGGRVREVDLKSNPALS